MRHSVLAVVAAAALAAAFIGTIGSAATNETRLDPAHPTWWAKYLRVSAPSFTPAKPTGGASVKVGANIDVSNEEGPQSETAIAVNPSAPAHVVAGSNEIFRLPMRGYFSSVRRLHLGSR